MDIFGLSPLIAKLIAGVLATLGVIAGFLVNNARQRARGREAERDRAHKAQVDATAKAEAERVKAARKPVTQQRKELNQWERD